MDAASPEKSRPGEAMADVPQKPSRGPLLRWDFFHRPNASLFGVLYCFFRHWPRSAVRSCIFNVTRAIPMLFGLYRNCEKHGPTNSHTDSCYSIETQSLAPAWVSAVRNMGSQPTSHGLFAVRGRTVLLSAGWGSCRCDFA